MFFLFACKRKDKRYLILPLQNNLKDYVHNTNMTYSRNSEAYNIDYTLVNSNIPRYWSLGTKNA